VRGLDSPATARDKRLYVLTDATEAKFHVGERWQYKTRPGEESSSLTIVKVEQSTRTGTIVHVSLDGLKVRNPTSPSGYSPTIAHLAFAETAVEESVVSLLTTVAALPSFEEGYSLWRDAFDQGKAGVFSVPVAQGVDFIESTLNP
jgi:hypothetical protein